MQTVTSLSCLWYCTSVWSDAEVPQHACSNHAGQACSFKSPRCQLSLASVVSLASSAQVSPIRDTPSRPMSDYEGPPQPVSARDNLLQPTISTQDDLPPPISGCNYRSVTTSPPIEPQSSTVSQAESEDSSPAAINCCHYRPLKPPRRRLHSQRSDKTSERNLPMTQSATSTITTER